MTPEAGGRLTGNLPQTFTDLVGRNADIEALRALLLSARLLTLTGPGGSGKTRLALELAYDARQELAGGAWWVGLSAVEQDGLVAAQAVSDLGVGLFPARPAAEALFPRLGIEPSLLVLDNCEQVVDGCVALVRALLLACPELKVIATSRQPLGVPDEQVFRVGGLAIEREQEGAIDLFVARARRHLPTLDDDEPTLTSIAEICEQVDGMPLAIELAAARTPMMTPGEIARRLAEDSRLLSRQGGGRPPRQQSMEAALSWSHRLLSDTQQAVFCRLSVFPTTFNLEAAEAVAAGAGVDRRDVLDALAGLVDQSLVDTSRTGTETRYRLLLVVRQYAVERLERSGDTLQTRERYLRYFLEIVDRGRGQLGGPGQAHWLERLETEHDNLRAAVVLAHATDGQIAARLVAGLWEFWYRHGHYQEGRRQLEEVVAAAAEATPATRAAILTGAAAFAMLQCDYGLAETRLQRALELYRELSDQRGVAHALQRLGGIARERGQYERSVDLHEQSLTIWRALGDEAGIADSLHYVGFALWLAGDFDRSEGFCDHAIELYLAREEMQEVAAVRVNLGAVAHYQGDDARAAVLLDQAIELSGQFGYQEGLAWALHERGVVAVAGHDLTSAAELFVGALRLHSGLGDQWRATRVLEDIAGALLVRSEPTRAAQLLASADSARLRLGAPVPSAERAEQDRYVASLRRTLSAAEFKQAWRNGRHLALEDAVREADAAVERLYLTGAERRIRVDDVLSPREAEVLPLLGQGRTNREIGAALFISPATAGVHVSSILRKLNVRSRAEAVARAHKLGLLADQTVGSKPH